MLTVIGQQALNALQLGSAYALLAVGYTMVYGVLRLINFAHADVFMVGAFIGFSMHHYWVDQFIWRPGKSEQLRRELKLT